MTIGDNVIVTIGSKYCVKRAWISSEKTNNLTAIFVPKSGKIIHAKERAIMPVK